MNGALPRRRSQSCRSALVVCYPLIRHHSCSILALCQLRYFNLHPTPRDARETADQPGNRGGSAEKSSQIAERRHFHLPINGLPVMLQRASLLHPLVVSFVSLTTGHGPPLGSPSPSHPSRPAPTSSSPFLRHSPAIAPSKYLSSLGPSTHAWRTATLPSLTAAIA
jgi:hypothetical protein